MTHVSVTGAASAQTNKSATSLWRTIYKRLTLSWSAPTNVVYRLSCPEVDCRLLQVDYVGATTTTLSRRLTMHLADGAPKVHMYEKHQRHLTRKDLTENTDIIMPCSDKKKLFILEALVIKEESPIMNIQAPTSVTLQLFRQWGVNYMCMACYCVWRVYLTTQIWKYPEYQSVVMTMWMCIICSWKTMYC